MWSDGYRSECLDIAEKTVPASPLEQTLMTQCCPPVFVSKVLLQHSHAYPLQAFRTIYPINLLKKYFLSSRKILLIILENIQTEYLYQTDSGSFNFLQQQSCQVSLFQAPNSYNVFLSQEHSQVFWGMKITWVLVLGRDTVSKNRVLLLNTHKQHGWKCL
jgi:hypothetical protein